jgi:hypothetical protein
MGSAVQSKISVHGILELDGMNSRADGSGTSHQGAFLDLRDYEPEQITREEKAGRPRNMCPVR